MAKRDSDVQPLHFWHAVCLSQDFVFRFFFRTFNSYRGHQTRSLSRHIANDPPSNNMSDTPCVLVRRLCIVRSP
jgi:hypothetical protein